MIISASRRTDIPAFYSDWLINRLEQGFVYVPNPRFPKRISLVDLSPEAVDCIVFWTKNPAPMISKLKTIQNMGYHFYFTFTLTPYDSSIEANLPPKAELIETFKKISGLIGAEMVDWRYDPIILNERFSVAYHLEAFEKLCGELSQHTTRCIISFIDSYRHLKNAFAELESERIRELAKGLSAIAARYSLPLFTCAEAADLSEFKISHSSCIDGDKISRITGRVIKAKRDSGQRMECGCAESADIGAYNTCSNGCAYCYAVTSKSTLAKNYSKREDKAPSLTGFLTGNEIITKRK